ncbi:MAG: DEAD/DEAH box helicase [Corynebacterium sp.]|nr:DEAD/DEAH box helicase [Corynebacterium sp.]
MNGPLIVQSDHTVMLEVDHPDAPMARLALAPFAELERAPEHIHTYRITPLALWNARATGYDVEQAIDVLDRYSKFPPPQSVLVFVAETMAKYGRLVLHKHPAHGLTLEADEPSTMMEIRNHKKTAPLLGALIDPTTCEVAPSNRGRVKQALIEIGWPVDDRAGYVDGEHHEIHLREDGWAVRDYQKEAADLFVAAGSGVVVLPCGGGKTLVGLSAMSRLQSTTLILVTTAVAGRQWRDEILRRTDVRPEDIGEYNADRKEIRPITIATYQVITRKTKGELKALELFDAYEWGLIIYDEVHILPTPVFGMTADLQARRRLGLTATLVREDGKENSVFSLIGPKRYEVAWTDLQARGFIAEAHCTEVRCGLDQDEKMLYAQASKREQHRIASCSESKIATMQKILRDVGEKPTLIIGAYIEQLEDVQRLLKVPLIDGRTTNKKREELFQQFREGTIKQLIVSKVANFSIDLPDAQVAIQLSGTFGSRQEEAQRLGRILRPKSDGSGAEFYSIVTRDTVDAEFSQNRQRFLAEQGYAYSYRDSEDL